MERNILVGRVLLGMQIAEDGGAVKFSTDMGDVVALCDADCCSHTWIEHIELPALGFPCKVTAVDEELEMPNLDDQREEDDGNDCVKYYGCKVDTDKGTIILDYRNSSNGYYGGSLNFPDANGAHPYHYGGVYGQNNSNMIWKDINA